MNRRAHSRCRFEADVGLVAAGDEKRFFGRCVNIGQGGVLVRSDPVLEIGSTITLLICFPDIKSTCKVRCQVQWNDAKEKIAGLVFKQLAPKEGCSLVKLLQRLARVERQEP